MELKCSCQNWNPEYWHTFNPLIGIYSKEITGKVQDIIIRIFFFNLKGQQEGSNVREPATKPEDLSSVLWIYMVEERYNCHKMPSDFHMYLVAHAYTHAINKM